MSRAQPQFELAERCINTLCWLTPTSKNYDNGTGRIH